jgi:hypothetical protein
VNRLRRHCSLALVAVCMAAMSGHAASVPSVAEQTRIDRLIDAVAQNKQARFIRNGSEYSAADAAEFLRKKLDAYGDRVKTVHDFIDLIGSKSSTSGQLYKVRLADGREVPSGDFLRAELTRLEAGR